MQKFEIEAEQGLLLKTFSLDDDQELFAMIDRNRARLREWLPWLDYNKEVKDSRKFIEGSHVDFECDKNYVFGLWLKGALIGVASFQNVNKSNKSSCIGYWIDEKAAGQGWVVKATKAMVSYGFNQLNLNRVEIRCATGNLNSQRIPEKLGFKFEGVARQCEWLYDHFVDHQVYAILQTD